MAGGDVQFRLATPADDAGLRRLLRENPMGGDVRLSLEREPSYLAAAAIEGPEQRTIVAEENGRIVCAGSISVRSRYVNGRAINVGYLGGLRLDAACRNRMSIIRGGYAMFRRMHEEARAAQGMAPSPGTPGEGWGGGRVEECSRITDSAGRPSDVLSDPATYSLSGPLPNPPPEYRERGPCAVVPPPYLYFTSIVADNLPARRLLERGLPGMPTYAFLGEIVTFLIPRRRRGHLIDATSLPRRRLRGLGLSLEHGSASLLSDVVDLLTADAHRGQLAPVWTADDFTSPQRCPGLDAADFRLVRSADGPPVACAALWDQRSTKQTIVRGYSPRLARLRPLLNAFAAVAGYPRLPPVGGAVAHAFVSHVAGPPGDPRPLEWLVRTLLGPARTRGIDYLTLGLDARDQRLPHLRRSFRPREYRSRLYGVHWDAAGADVLAALDGRLLAPEVATL